jgi:peptidoglycan/xylan/chitin deacetylase (PgdA/CDA1 family)
MKAVTQGRVLLVGASMALASLVAARFLGLPIPWWGLWVMLLSYCGLVLWGVLNLRLEMFGSAICAVPGARGVIALTFDDGPDPTSTPIVLDQLRQAKAKATFFVIGEKVTQHPMLVARIAAEGHELGIHGHKHDRFYALRSCDWVRNDILGAQSAISSAAGVVTRWFRPPVGQLSPSTARGVLCANVRTVGFSLRAWDGLRSTRAEDVVRRIVPRLRGGAIVLLHDARERPTSLDQGLLPPAVSALSDVLAACETLGLRCVTLADMLRVEKDGKRR